MFNVDMPTVVVIILLIVKLICSWSSIRMKFTGWMQQRRITEINMTMLVKRLLTSKKK